MNKENDSSRWRDIFTERLEKKNLTPEELTMLEDFGVSLEMIEAFKGNVDNPIVKFHLGRTNYIINYFAEQEI